MLLMLRDRFSLFFKEGVRGSFLRWVEKIRSAVRERPPTPSLKKRGRWKKYP
jgi:hypothetical protein